MTPDVDAAREALYNTKGYPMTPSEYRRRLDTFEAAIRAEEGRWHERWIKDGEAEASLRADVEAKLAALREDERLGDALHSTFHPTHSWSGCHDPDAVYRYYIPRFRAALAATPAEEPEPFHICPACGTGHNLEGDPAYAATPADDPSGTNPAYALRHMHDAATPAEEERT